MKFKYFRRISYVIMLVPCCVASILFLLLIYLEAHSQEISGGILYPRPSETREVISLNGLWHFSYLNSSVTYKEWHKNLDFHETLMPVPASYNDVTTDWRLRDHVGVVWYERNFFVPKSWKSQRVWIRFSSVCYSATVIINGKEAVWHTIGHLPFQKEISVLVDFEQENHILVGVDNTLSKSTIPQGVVEKLNSGRLKLKYTFDFFNYAGIDRPVVLYTTPNVYIDDVTVQTAINGTIGLVKYRVIPVGNYSKISVSIRDRSGAHLGMYSNGVKGYFRIENANFWWPYLMHDDPGYLYTLQVDLLDDSHNLIDRYRQPFGIREVTWTKTQLLINHKPIYLRGFGRHEDSDIRGKGLDLPLIIRDYNLIKWIGANAYRTSHYPYAEEIMDLADQYGIMIIDECPSVDTDGFSDELLTNHKRSLTELIKRDKNRPSVIMWSVANEPRTSKMESDSYFRKVIEHVKAMDSSRPVTIAENTGYGNCKSSQYVDIISLNVYNAWYGDEGNLDIITDNVIKIVQNWHSKFNKPVMFTEYGADTLSGLHFVPTYIWSEEYQVELFSQHFKAFDRLRRSGYFVGELIWNFADFKTEQGRTRVGGNKKGIFTRNRQPKASAHLVRKRYWALAKSMDNFRDVPNDLYTYVSSDKNHDEL